MPKATESHELPYPESTDAADVPSDMQALAEQVDSELDDIAPSQIASAGKGDEAKLLVVQNTGAAAFKALSGDVTINAAGVVEIGKEKVGAEELDKKAVGTDKLNDGAVTSPKAKLTAGVVVATGNLTLTTSYQDVPGAVLGITPAVASKLKITAVFHMQAIGTASSAIGFLGSVKVDAEAEQTRVAQLNGDISGKATETNGTVSQVYILPLTAAAHTIKLRAKIEGDPEAGSGKVFASNTAFLYELIAA